MEKKVDEKLVLKLDIIQESLWKAEDYIIKTLGLTEMNRSELQEIKYSLSLINSKIESIDAEIRGMRSNGQE